MEGRVWVRWETALEAGTIAFDLFRDVDGEWRRVNALPIPAVNTIRGGRYEVRDATAPTPGPHRYRVVATLDTGLTTDLGTREVRAEVALGGESLERERAEPKPGTRLLAPEVARQPAPAGLPGPVNMTASPARVKLQTTKAGWHFLSAASLAGLLGQAPSVVQGWVSRGEVALSNRGQAVTYLPGEGWVAAGQTGPGLFFYAEPIKNNYTATNVYWLGAGGRNRFATVDGGHPPATVPGAYTAVLEAEQDRYEALTAIQDAEQDFWFWATLTANSAADTFTTSFAALERLVRKPARPPGWSQSGSTADAHPRQVDCLPERAGRSAPAPGRVWYPGSRVRPRRGGHGAPPGRGGGRGQQHPGGAGHAGARGAGEPRMWTATRSATGGPTKPSRVRRRAGRDTNATVTVPGFSGVTPPPILAVDMTDVRQPKEIQNLRVDKLGTVWAVSFDAGEAAHQRFAVLQKLVKASTQFPARLTLVHPANLSIPPGARLRRGGAGLPAGERAGVGNLSQRSVPHQGRRQSRTSTTSSATGW